MRSLVGLDREAAKRAFGEFLEGSRFNAAQIAFVNLLVDYLTSAGTIEPGTLYEQPFTNASPLGLDGVFTSADAERLVQVLATVNGNAAGIQVRPA